MVGCDAYGSCCGQQQCQQNAGSRSLHRTCPTRVSLALGCGGWNSAPKPFTRGLEVLGWKVHSRRIRSSSAALSCATLRAAFSTLASSSTVLACRGGMPIDNKHGARLRCSAFPQGNAQQWNTFEDRLGRQEVVSLFNVPAPSSPGILVVPMWMILKPVGRARTGRQQACKAAVQACPSTCLAPPH